MKKSSLLKLWLIIGILTGFATIIFFTINFLNKQLLCNISCDIKNYISISLVLISLFGVFIGSLTYYFISENYEQKITRIHKEVSSALKLLEPEEAIILKCLINNKGCNSQSEIVSQTKLSRVKVSRIIKRFEEKELITKTPSGMTNRITLAPDLQNLFNDELNKQDE